MKGGELVFGAESDVATLDVGAAAQPSDKVITLGIYDPLTTYVDGKIVPYLAESTRGRATTSRTYDDDPALTASPSTTARRSTPTRSSSTSIA